MFILEGIICIRIRGLGNKYFKQIVFYIWNVALSSSDSMDIFQTADLSDHHIANLWFGFA